jgi:hypothetical protein
MTLKLSIGLVAAAGLAALLASARAQQGGGFGPHPPQDVANTPASVTPPLQNRLFYTTPETRPMVAVPASPDGQNTFVTPFQSTDHARYGVSPLNWSSEDNSLARSADELAKRLEGAKSDADRSKIKSQLSEILEKQFDLRQKRHLEEIKALEAKIKKLKDLVEKRQENRREIVSKRLDQILSDAEGLGW